MSEAQTCSSPIARIKELISQLTDNEGNEVVGQIVGLGAEAFSPQLEAIGSADAQAVSGLEKAPTDTEAKVRGAAFLALGQTVDAKALPSLIALLDDPHPHLREAVGKLGDKCVAPRLRAMLGDDDKEVREAAQDALSRLH